VSSIQVCGDPYFGIWPTNGVQNAKVRKRATYNMRIWFCEIAVQKRIKCKEWFDLCFL